MIASELIARVTVLGADKAKADLLGVGTASDSVGEKLGKGLAFGALAGAAALVGIGIAATKMAGDFQQEVNRLKTGGGDLQDTFTSLWSGIQKVSDATGVLTKPLSDAMYLVVSSGQRGAQAMGTLTAAAQGAQIEMANVGDVAQILTTIQTNFGVKTYTAAQYMDGLVAAVSHGKITLEDLSTSMSPILPMAHELGIHFSDVSAAMADMTNQGVPADRAAQALRFTMQSMIEPTTASRTAMAQWGLDTAKVAETMKTSLPNALQMYITAAKRAGAEGTQPFIDALGSMVGGGTRAGQALWALSQSMGTWRQDIKDVNTALGDTNKNVAGWSTAQSNLNIQLDRGKAVLETVMQNLGEKLLPIVTPLIGKFADWVEQIGQLGSANLGGFISALQSVGSLLGKIGGFVINSQEWKSAASNIGAAADQLGRVVQNLSAIASGTIDIAGHKVNILKSGVESLGAAFDILGKGITSGFLIGNILMDTMQHKTLSVEEAVFQLNGTINTGKLSVKDATDLMALGYTHVKDTVTGADITLQKFIASGGKVTSTTISMNDALKLLGDKAGHILNAADAAKLLALGVHSVDDAAHRASVSMDLLAGSAKNVGVNMATLAATGVKVTNGVTNMSGALKILGESKGHVLNVRDAEILLADGVKYVNDKLLGTINLQKLINNYIVQLKIHDEQVLAANAHAHDAYNSLMRLNAPVKTNVDSGSINNAWSAAMRAHNAMMALNGTSRWTAYLNQVTIGTIAGQGPRPFASGTQNYPGGVGLVGEQGPELVTPPRGSRIYTAAQTRGLLAGGGSSTIDVHVYLDKGAFARELSGPLMPEIVTRIRNATGARF